MEKKYKRFVKPLIARLGPEGLYPDVRFWMESKDWEGLNAHFSYGFIRKPGVICHPMEENKALVHPYDEVLVFAGIDTSDIFKLGAEVSIEFGEESEEYTFNEPVMVVVPKGTPHGPIKVKKLDAPIMHYLVGLGSDYKATTILKKSKSSETKYSHLIKPLKIAAPTPEQQEQMKALRIGGPGNADQLAWLYGRHLEGLEVNLSWGFYSKAGIWHRIGDGGAHIHPVDEALIFVGLNPDNLYELGAEVEFALGEEQERHVIDRPAAVICPKGLVHCPEITRWVDKTYGFIVFCLGSEHETHWLPRPTYL